MKLDEMDFIIADTFTRAIGRLDKQSRSLVKQAAFDFQLDPAKPGLQCHKLDRAVDRNFWSARVSRDLRIIFYKRQSDVTLCYAGHHDEAYAWAERRKFQVHPHTGAAQIVEVVEKVQEKIVTRVRERHVDPPLFDQHEPDYLLSLGVPLDWLEPVRMANEEQLYAILEHLPEEAAERLFRLASGAPVPIPARSGASGTIASRSDASRSEEAPRSGSGAGRGIQEAMSGMGAGPDPFAHEDAKRRFRVMDSQDELRLALEAPWERWVVFLHPSQRKVIERTYNGPARVAGAAGTGKTVVALHRAAFLARSSSQTRVLLTTFSKTLATRLGQNADLLLGRETPVRQRVEIVHLHKLARDRWVEETGEPLNVISPSQLKELIGRANRAVGTGELDVDFLRAEWNAVVDPWGIDSRNRYKVARRAGRGTRLNARQRLDVWKIFAEVQEWLRDRDLMTWDQLVNGVARRLEGRKRKPFTHVIVDEAQDFGPAELRLLRALVPQGKNDLFFCADAGQRIYRATFTWKSTGVDIRGRSSRLTVNYRTTEQIRGFSDRLSPPGVVSATGENEPRDSVSLLRGPVPEVLASRTPEAEVKKLARVFKGLKRAGYAPRDIGVFARRTELLKERAIPAIEAAGLSHAALTDSVAPSARSVSVGTMHRAKGLEFKVVFVVGCDRAVLPLRSSLDRLCDASDRQGFVDRERNLLYVACTRARERLYVSHTGAPTVFLAELEER